MKGHFYIWMAGERLMSQTRISIPMQFSITLITALKTLGATRRNETKGSMG